MDISVIGLCFIAAITALLVWVASHKSLGPCRGPANLKSHGIRAGFPVGYTAEKHQERVEKTLPTRRTEGRAKRDSTTRLRITGFIIFGNFRHTRSESHRADDIYRNGSSRKNYSQRAPSTSTRHRHRHRHPISSSPRHHLLTITFRSIATRILHTSQ